MEKRKKRTKRTKKVEETKVEKITYDTFFTKMVLSGKVKSWQKAEIWSYFEDCGLKSDEDLEKYKKILEKY